MKKRLFVSTVVCILFAAFMLLVGCAAMDNAIVNTDSMKNVMREQTVKSLRSDVAPEDVKIIPGESSFSGTQWIAEFPDGMKYRCNKAGKADAYCAKVKKAASK